MQHYILLGTVTTIIIILAFVIWKRTGNISFPLGIALLYYWTLFGAWFIIQDLLGADSGMRYHYYFYALFPVYLDQDYLWTIALYALFIVVLEITVLYTVKSSGRNPHFGPPIRISHTKVVVFASLAGLAGYLIVKNSLAAAADINRSGYGYVRSDPSVSPSLFALYQLLTRVPLVSLAIGLAVLCSGDHPRYMVGKHRTLLRVMSYLAALLCFFHFNLIMGNRQELITALTTGALFYIANTPRPKKVFLAGICFLMAIAVGYVGVTRGNNPYGGLKRKEVAETISNALSDDVLSNEPFEAHLSLYGCLSKHVKLTYGTSIVSLAASIVPQALWSHRPVGVYEYYTRAVGALEGQGYTIHHATGWYINFGVPGLIVGAIIFGWFWSKLFNQLYATPDSQAHASRVFTVLAFWTFTAWIPALARAGPEGYKNIALEALLGPTLFMTAASMRFVIKSNRPAFVPGGFANMGLRGANPSVREDEVNRILLNEQHAD